MVYIKVDLIALIGWVGTNSSQSETPEQSD